MRPSDLYVVRRVNMLTDRDHSLVDAPVVNAALADLHKACAGRKVSYDKSRAGSRAERVAHRPGSKRIKPSDPLAYWVTATSGPRSGIDSREMFRMGRPVR